MTNIASQTSPSEGIQPQNHVIAMEQPPENQTRNEPVLFLSCFKNFPTDIQESEKPTTSTSTGETTIPPLTLTTPLIKEK